MAWHGIMNKIFFFFFFFCVVSLRRGARRPAVLGVFCSPGLIDGWMDGSRHKRDFTYRETPRQRKKRFPLIITALFYLFLSFALGDITIGADEEGWRIFFFYDDLADGGLRMAASLYLMFIYASLNYDCLRARSRS